MERPRKILQKELKQDPYKLTFVLGRPKKSVQGIDIGDGVEVFIEDNRITHITFDTLKGWNKTKASKWLNTYNGKPLPNPTVKPGSTKTKFDEKDVDIPSGRALYYRARVRNPEDFNQRVGFFTIPFNKEDGIKAVIGRLRGEVKSDIQTMLFHKDKWTVPKVVKWMNEHSGRF